MEIKTFLTIAASDCMGGAGIAADIKTAEAFGLFGMSAQTAMTAQNSSGLHAILASPEDFMESQLSSIFEEVVPDVVKIGMCADDGQLKAVKRFLSRHKNFPVVVDPVLSVTAGDFTGRQSDNIARTYSEELAEVADIITPNREELTEIVQSASGADAGDCASEEDKAEFLLNLGWKAVLVTGSETAKDHLYMKNMPMREFCSPYVATKNHHGTGCVYSSAIASSLALQRFSPSSDIFEYDIEKAVADGKAFVYRNLERYKNIDFGRGYGPANFFI